MLQEIQKTATIFQNSQAKTGKKCISDQLCPSEFDKNLRRITLLCNTPLGSVGHQVTSVRVSEIALRPLTEI